MTELLQTPLTQWHKDAGAKMAPFAGWEMPIQYTGGIIAEHLHTRSKASLFDICHMGEFSLAGPGSLEALSTIVTHNLATLQPGRCRYGFLPNERGGVQDDLIVYRLGEESFMLVVNGATTEGDFAWISERLPAGLTLVDKSSETAKIDLQGPASLDALEAILGRSFRDLKYFNFLHMEFEGAPLMVSRTGYTGELGYELYLHVDKALALWERCLADPRVEPAGLGARDTLRLEVGLPLYGQDLDVAHTPAEAGFQALLTSTAGFTGKDAVLSVREKLIGLAFEGRRSARTHDTLLLPSGQEVGLVTSGSFAPSLGHAVALAYVEAEHADQDSFLVKTAKTALEARRVDLPFYKDGTARMKF